MSRGFGQEDKKVLVKEKKMKNGFKNNNLFKI